LTERVVLGGGHQHTNTVKPLGTLCAGGDRPRRRPGKNCDEPAPFY